MRDQLRVVSLVLLVMTGALITAEAAAGGRGTRSDSSPTFDDQLFGSSWSSITTINGPFDPTLSDPLNIGFLLNYGQPFDPSSPDSGQIHIYGNGYVSFGPGFVDPGVVGGVIQDNVAAPGYLSADADRIDYATGKVDPTEPFNESDAFPAFRVTWFASGFPFQIVLLDTSNVTGHSIGDFDMEFNYGFSGEDPPNDPPADLFQIVGFALSSANVSGALDGPFNSGQIRTWSFVKGVGTFVGEVTTTPVTEPGSLVLMAAGLLVLVAARWRRNRALQSVS